MEQPQPDAQPVGYTAPMETSSNQGSDQDLDQALTMAIGYMRALREETPQARQEQMNETLQTVLDGATPADVATTLSLVSTLAASLSMELNPGDPYSPILAWAHKVRSPATPEPDVR